MSNIIILHPTFVGFFVCEMITRFNYPNKGTINISKPKIPMIVLTAFPICKCITNNFNFNYIRQELCLQAYE